MSASADRNLLYGILAPQMDFVTRDQLIEAMHAWVLQKQTPLGEILRHRGALEDDTAQLLERLVDRHVEQHGQDPRRSLAALSAAPELVAALGGDDEVRSSLAALATPAGGATLPPGVPHGAMPPDGL